MSNKPSLVEWLASLPGIREVKPLKVTIGPVTYDAASYLQDMEADKSCRNPGPYTREMVYCLGRRPKVVKGRPENKCCYTRLDDPRIWYVAGYTEEIKPEHQEYNPLGHNFLLAPWNVDGSIDDGERKPYTRVPITVEAV